eukprot:TRINITY_DN48666_c0_g1_i1.p2 TRINITY_DN48666_c0_g1~~TRINITY_DN48666_c0_g1_i1.p2  ORF type:complete len:169 (+),score=24.37 TRINITY_DN48666_c0_g1_i1:68-508(+)
MQEAEVDGSTDLNCISNAHCTVRKHRYVGCAIVKVASAALCSAVMNRCRQNIQAEASVNLGGTKSTVTVHKRKNTDDADPTSLFVTWGRQQEKRASVDVATILEAFTAIVQDILREVPLSDLAPDPDNLPRGRFDGSNLLDAMKFQ